MSALLRHTTRDRLLPTPPSPLSQNTLRDPLPGLPKQLSLHYHVNAANEDLFPEEMAPDGLSFRTYWIRKTFDASIRVDTDPETSQARLAEPVHFQAIASIPQLSIVKAAWEVVRTGFKQDVVHNSQDITRQFTALVQKQGNCRLQVQTEDNLYDLLDVDPPRRPYNKLHVTYEVRGVESSMVVQQRPDCNALMSPVLIGYLPQYAVPTHDSIDAVDTLHPSMTLTEASRGGSVAGLYGDMDELGLGRDDESVRSLASSRGRFTAEVLNDVGVLKGLVGGRYKEQHAGGKGARERAPRERVAVVLPQGLGQPSVSSTVSGGSSGGQVSGEEASGSGFV